MCIKLSYSDILIEVLKHSLDRKSFYFQVMLIGFHEIKACQFISNPSLGLMNCIKKIIVDKFPDATDEFNILVEMGRNKPNSSKLFSYFRNIDEKLSVCFKFEFNL